MDKPVTLPLCCCVDLYLWQTWRGSPQSVKLIQNYFAVLFKVLANSE